MKQRHALWSSLATGRGSLIDTQEKRVAVARWNIVTICERFGWTPDYVLSLPQSFLEDVVTILNVKDHYANSSPVTNGNRTGTR